MNIQELRHLTMLAKSEDFSEEAAMLKSICWPKMVEAANKGKGHYLMPDSLGSMGALKLMALELKDAGFQVQWRPFLLNHGALAGRRP
ncbi:unnamed protein product, partial [marine sediment metagenome]